MDNRREESRQALKNAHPRDVPDALNPETQRIRDVLTGTPPKVAQNTTVQRGARTLSESEMHL